MSYILGIFAFALWLGCLLFKTRYAPIACMVFIVSDYWFGVSPIFTTITKLLMLITFFIIIIRKCRISRIKLLTPLIVLFIIQFFVYVGNHSYSYGFNSFITSYLTIMLGFSLFAIVWDEKVRHTGFVVLAWSASICVILGILQKGALFNDGRIISGTWLPHTPGSLGAVGILACITLKETYKDRKYQYLLYFNFLIVAASQVRGMLIFACIMLIPDVFNMLRHLNKKNIFFLSVLVAGAVFFLPSFIKPLLERTFVGEGEINSSGRLDAWPYFLKLSEDYRLFGMGIGRIKTFEDQALVNFPSAHNEYLRFIVETGIVGLSVMLYQFRSVFMNIWRKSILKDKRYYLMCYFIAFVGLAFVENVMSGHLFWIPYCMVLSLMWVEPEQKKLAKL